MSTIFCPSTMASILGHSQSITRSSTSVNCTVGAGVVAVLAKVRRIPSLNLGSSRNNCSSVIVTCIPVKSEMSGSIPLLDGPSASVSTALPFAARWALGLHFRILLRVCLLNPVLRLFADTILFCP
jgi:hypothetical protein